MGKRICKGIWIRFCLSVFNFHLLLLSLWSEFEAIVFCISISRKPAKKVTVKEENNSEEEEEGEEEAGGTEEQSEEEEEEEEEEGDGEEEEEEEEEEEGGYYNLRKRQPVIYHFQPVHEVTV